MARKKTTAPKDNIDQLKGFNSMAELDEFAENMYSSKPKPVEVPDFTKGEWAQRGWPTKKVRVICTDNKFADGKRPIVVLDRHNMACYLTALGKDSDNFDSMNDLVPLGHEVPMENDFTKGEWAMRDWPTEKVRVLCVDLPGEYPVAVADRHGEVYTCTADGVGEKGFITPYDLVPLEVKPLERWANVYEGGRTGTFHETKKKVPVVEGGSWVRIARFREVPPWE